MTPPKVDISALQKIHLEHLEGLDRKQVNQLFDHTDLVLDEKTGELQVKAKAGHEGEVPATSLEMEALWIQSIQQANKNGDQYLEMSEVKSYIFDNRPAEVAALIDPKKFLESTALLMKDRYGPLAKNFQSYGGLLAFQPTLDSMRHYNHGLLSEGYRHANSVFALNGLTKTAVNIGGIVTGSLVGDKKAKAEAKERFELREGAINKLSEVIRKGLDGNEKWALDNDIEAALKQLDAPTAELLTRELAAVELHKMLNAKTESGEEDKKTKYTQLQTFADKDRPGFLGFGTGNTSAGWFTEFYNYSGHRYNPVFSRTLYRFLAAKANTGDKVHDQTMQLDATASLADSEGDGGSFTNLFAVGGTSLLCGAGWVFTAGQKVNMSTCPHEYRDWSDEEYQDALGRGIDVGVMLYGGRGVWGRGSQFTKLGVMEGAGTAGRTWLAKVKDGRWYSAPLRVLGTEKQYAEAILKAEKEAELIGEADRVGKTWLGRGLTRVYGGIDRLLFKNLGRLSPEAEAMARKGVKVAGKVDVTKWITLALIASHADEKLRPAFNPLSFDHQADFDRYPDPTKPLVPPETKK